MEIDKFQDYKHVIADIAAVKAAMPAVFRNVTQRALQIHGALGISNEMPFVRMMIDAAIMGIADGPTEVHKVSLARQILKKITEPSALSHWAWTCAERSGPCEVRRRTTQALRADGKLAIDAAVRNAVRCVAQRPGE